MKSRNHRSAALLAVALMATMPLWAQADNGVVNINTAGTEQLVLLPRVGPSVAQRIVEHREINGKFKSKEDLMLVRGVGEATFTLLEPHVTVNGETTLTEKVQVSKKSSSGS